MRVLIAIMTCVRYADRRAAIRSTWMPFVRGANVLFADGPSLDSPDTYDTLPLKTYRMVQFAERHGYDTLIKVDDDTFFMPLPEYIAEFAKHDCMGYVRSHRIPYPQGGCYSLSRRAMQAVLVHPEFFVPGVIEDGAVGRALAAESIALTHTERIKTTHLYGFPQPGNRIISAHCCQPATLLNIFRHNQARLRLMFAF